MLTQTRKKLNNFDIPTYLELVLRCKASSFYIENYKNEKLYKRTYIKRNYYK